MNILMYLYIYTHLSMIIFIYLCINTHLSMNILMYLYIYNYKAIIRTASQFSYLLIQIVSDLSILISQ